MAMQVPAIFLLEDVHVCETKEGEGGGGEKYNYKYDFFLAVCDECENGVCIAPSTCNCTTGWYGAGCDTSMSSLFLFLQYMYIVFTLLSACDANATCNSHGHCDGNNCVCSTPYLGNSCQCMYLGEKKEGERGNTTKKLAK